MPLIFRKLRTAVLAAALCALVLPALAQAGTNQFSIMMDDDLLVYRSDATRDAALRQMKGLGADAVRVTVLWSVVADGAKDKKNLKRFNKFGASNPKAYPRANWDRYDRLSRACKTLSLRCYFDVTGPGPSYGHSKPPARYKRDAKQWKPKPREFYKFVQAVGKRYTGSYRDENDARTTLPRIDFWAIWNEPNQGGWLRPQFLNGKPASPAIYRQLWFFGRRALESTGHGKDVILVGETAPLGGPAKSTRAPMGPKTFINEFLCGPGSTGDGCGDFDKYGPIQATAYAHHPYTRKNSPLTRDADPEAITLANFDELAAELDGISAATGHIATGLPLISTEFGYETNPPDPFASLSYAQQALYNQIGDYVTYLNPRVVANTQFLLRDVKPDKRHKAGSKAYWHTYQSGLLTAGGTPKPSATAYTFPFLAFPAVTNELGQTVYKLWGQIRFRQNGLSPEAPDSVQLQFQPAGTPDWIPFGTPVAVTSAFGFFGGDFVSPGAGNVRAVWAGPQTPFNVQSLGQPVNP